MEQTFLLTITGAENGEWQGHVTGLDDQAVAFKSVMELLKLVQKELEEAK